MSNFSKDNRPGETYMMGGKAVSRGGYGTMQLPKLKDEAKARAVIRKAYELGVNHFDTADFMRTDLQTDASQMKLKMRRMR